MTNSALATQNGNLAVVQQQDFNAEQIELIANMIGVRPGTTEFNTFINIAKKKRLDPLTRQIYCIRPRGGGMQIFASIDGLRVIAQRTGEYGGQTAPLWCGEDLVWREAWLDEKPPAAAKVGVWKKGFVEPTWGVATFKSYGEGKTGNWGKMPDVMLAKCAEALALRKAFPDDLSALYVREEFADTETPEPTTNASTAPTARPERTPVTAEVVDATFDTGDMPPTKEELGEQIKSLRELLGWSQEDVRTEARKQKVDLRTPQGLQDMVDILAGYGYERQGDNDDEPEQGTLLDAETAPLDRWADR